MTRPKNDYPVAKVQRDAADLLSNRLAIKIAKPGAWGQGSYEGYNTMPHTSPPAMSLKASKELAEAFFNAHRLPRLPPNHIGASPIIDLIKLLRNVYRDGQLSMAANHEEVATLQRERDAYKEFAEHNRETLQVIVKLLQKLDD